MHHHYWILWRMAEEQRRDLMRNLENDRLVRLAQSAREPHRSSHGRVAEGSNRLRQLLVKLGSRLQAGTALLYDTVLHATYHARSKPHTHGG